MGYPIDEQRLFYNNEEELFDYRILKFYAFKDYYTPISLYHVPKGSSLISVKLEVNSYVYNCKIVVNPSTLIRDIKEQLNDRKVIPLFIPLMYNGQVLEDDKSVQYYNMPTQPEEKILLKANLSYKLGDKKKITLFVSLNCEFNIYVDPSDLVVELKKFLMLKLNVSYYFIKIEYSDHELEDQRSLFECGIIESWPSIKAKIYSHRPINY